MGSLPQMQQINSPRIEGTSASVQEKVHAKLNDLQPTLQSMEPDMLQTLENVMISLHKMNETNPKFMFHLLFEVSTETDDSQHQIKTGELDVVYSPTIDPDEPRYRQFMLRAVGFFGMISSISRSMNSRGSILPVDAATSPIPVISAAQTPSPNQGPDHANFQQLTRIIQSQSPTKMHDLRIFSHTKLPACFPRQQYDAATQSTRAGNVIDINPHTYNKFKSLNLKKTMWIYTFFFKHASFAATRKYPNMKFLNLYQPFTPDWYYGDFQIGPNFYKYGVS